MQFTPDAFRKPAIALRALAMPALVVGAMTASADAQLAAPRAGVVNDVERPEIVVSDESDDAVVIEITRSELDGSISAYVSNALLGELAAAAEEALGIEVDLR